MTPAITIEYDGEDPNLCRGHLVAVVDGVRWEFPSFCLTSGGNVWFDDDWQDHVTQGPWHVDEWPADFSETLRDDVERVINGAVPWGCCGGCV